MSDVDSEDRSGGSRQHNDHMMQPQNLSATLHENDHQQETSMEVITYNSIINEEKAANGLENGSHATDSETSNPASTILKTQDDSHSSNKPDATNLTDSASKTPRTGKKWSCDICTFLNHGRDRLCWVCGHSNPFPIKRNRDSSGNQSSPKESQRKKMNIENTSNTMSEQVETKSAEEDAVVTEIAPYSHTQQENQVNSTNSQNSQIDDQPTNTEELMEMDETNVNTVNIKSELLPVPPTQPSTSSQPSTTKKENKDIEFVIARNIVRAIMEDKQEKSDIPHVKEEERQISPELPSSEISSAEHSNGIEVKVEQAKNELVVNKEVETTVTLTEQNAESLDKKLSIEVPSAVSVANIKEWSCGQCTFINPIKDRYCSVCRFANTQPLVKKPKRKQSDASTNKDELSVTSKVSDRTNDDQSHEAAQISSPKKKSQSSTANKSSSAPSIQTPKKAPEKHYDIEITEEQWKCPICTYGNPRHFRLCDICAFPLPATFKPETPSRKVKPASTPSQKKKPTIGSISTKPEELQFTDDVQVPKSETKNPTTIPTSTSKTPTNRNTVSTPSHANKSATQSNKASSTQSASKSKSKSDSSTKANSKYKLQSSSSLVAPMAPTVKDPVMIERLKEQVRKEIEAKPVKMNPICLEVYTEPPPIRRGMCIIWTCNTCKFDNLLKENICIQCKAAQYSEYRYIALCTYHKALEKRKYKRLGLLDEEEVAMMEAEKAKRKPANSNRKRNNTSSQTASRKSGSSSNKTSSNKSNNNNESSSKKRRRGDNQDLSYLLPPGAQSASRSRNTSNFSSFSINNNNNSSTRHTRNNDLSHVFQIDPSIDIDRLLRGRMGRGRGSYQRKKEDDINENPYKAPKIGTKYQISHQALPQVNDYHFQNPSTGMKEEHDPQANKYYDILWIPTKDCMEEYQSWNIDEDTEEDHLEHDHVYKVVRRSLDEVIDHVEHHHNPPPEETITTFKEYVQHYKKRALEVSALKCYYEQGYDIAAARTAVEEEIASRKFLLDMIPYKSSLNEDNHDALSKNEKERIENDQDGDDWLSKQMSMEIDEDRKTVMETLYNIVDEVDATITPIIPVPNTKPHYQKTTDLVIKIFPDEHISDFYNAIVKCGGDNWNEIVGEMGYRYSVAQLQDFYYTIWMYAYKEKYQEAERKHRMNKRLASRRRNKKRRSNPERKEEGDEVGEEMEEMGEDQGSYRANAEDDASQSIQDKTEDFDNAREGNTNPDEDSTLAEGGSDDDDEGDDGSGSDSENNLSDIDEGDEEGEDGEEEDGEYDKDEEVAYDDENREDEDGGEMDIADDANEEEPEEDVEEADDGSNEQAEENDDDGEILASNVAIDSNSSHHAMDDEEEEEDTHLQAPDVHKILEESN